MPTIVVSDPFELAAAAAAAGAGSRIRIAPGRYHEPSNMIDRQGRADAPIIFEAAAPGQISGGSQPDYRAGRSLPHLDGPGNPHWHDFAFLRLHGCSHIHITGLTLGWFWPTILFLRDCSDILIAGNTMRHGTNAIFATGCDRVTVEGNTWQQDDTEHHTLWHEVDWLEAHGGDGGMGTKRYYNGSFFAAKATGNVAILRNTISDAYNGVRMKASEIPPADEPEHNHNVVIEDNDFVRIRDNPIEPEFYAYNWRVAHNRIVDAHAWFSFDGVRGGYFYIYGNTARFTSRPGDPAAGTHTMGRVLKLSYLLAGAERPWSAQVPDYPWYVVHNSFALRCPIVGGAAERAPKPPSGGLTPDFTANLTFANNVFEWCSQETLGVHLCEWIALLRNFDVSSFDRVVFEASLTNRRDYLEQARSMKIGETAGIVAEAPLFAPEADGPFSLPEGSPGRGSAKVLEMKRPGRGRYVMRLNADGALHRGAVQEYGLVQLIDHDEGVPVG